jgi:hypothetical protein
LTGASPPPRTITLLDSRTRVPVAGALVFAPGELVLYRSDRRGQVTLPEEYGLRGIGVHGRLHKPLLLPPRTSGDVLLELDSARVTPLERQQVFDRADTLRGTYGPYRENNDLLSYDLSVAVDPAAQSIIECQTRARRWPEALRTGQVHANRSHHTREAGAGTFGGMVFDGLAGNPDLHREPYQRSIWWEQGPAPNEVDSRPSGCRASTRGCVERPLPGRDRPGQRHHPL